jgi:hypothetical protein
LTPFDYSNAGVWTPSIWKWLLGDRVIRKVVLPLLSCICWLLPPYFHPKEDQKASWSVILAINQGRITSTHVIYLDIFA